MTRTHSQSAAGRAAPLIALLLLVILLPAGPACTGEAADPSLQSQLTRALTPAQMRDVRLLQHLGWRLTRDAKLTEVVIEGGFPCRHETLSAAQSAGALRIRFPGTPTQTQLRTFGSRAAELAQGVASRCAYKHKIVIATRRAAARLKRLTDAGRYKFPKVFAGAVELPWFKVAMPKPEWRRCGKLWLAQGSAARAMEAFFRRGANAECYSGQALAVYTIQYELYGSAAFNKVFKAGDLALGQPLPIKETPLGRFTHWSTAFPWRALVIDAASQKEDPVVVLARQGRMAFVGLSGIVRNQKPDVTSNENWILTSMSDRAMNDLVRGGGLEHLSKRMRAVWDAWTPGRGLLTSGDKKRTAERRVDQLLAEPVFREIELYVHPYGVVSIGDVVREKMDRGVDTPLELVIYTHGREDELYRRYRDAFRRGWLERRRGAPTRTRNGR